MWRLPHEGGWQAAAQHSFTMDERTLLRASLLIAVMGLLALFAASSFGSIELVEIGKVDGTHPSVIKVQGIVESVRSAGEGQVIVIS